VLDIIREYAEKRADQGSENMTLTISVITPSFNQGRFIEQTINSVLSQNGSRLQYVVMDGGSTDETVNILKRYNDRLSWVSEKDKGQAHAVNKGIKSTSGEIIGWLNSDDVYYEGTIAAVLSFFEAHPEVEVIYGDADHIDIDGNVIESYYTEDWDHERLKEVCFICQPSVFFRRRIVEKAGLLDEKLQYCMDYEYWLRLGTYTSFVRLDKSLAGSRMYTDNKTLGERVAVHKEINDMFKKNLHSIPRKWIFAYSHAVIDAKGYRRDAPNEDLRYVMALICVTIFSFLRWKQGISGDALKVMATWLAGSLKGMAR
jgi:glycosyltransferase involved in cell wall biosynthesis